MLFMLLSEFASGNFWQIILFHVNTLKWQLNFKKSVKLIWRHSCASQIVSDFSSKAVLALFKNQVN